MYIPSSNRQAYDVHKVKEKDHSWTFSGCWGMFTKVKMIKPLLHCWLKYIPTQIYHIQTPYIFYHSTESQYIAGKNSSINKRCRFLKTFWRQQ